MAVKIFGQIHHSVIIRERLIKFHQRKFGIVTGVYALISENTSYFVNTFKTADDKSFEIKFKRNAEFYVLVKRVVMRFKRSCRRAARIGNQHRGLDFHKALTVEVSSDGSDYL